MGILCTASPATGFIYLLESGFRGSPPSLVYLTVVTTMISLIVSLLFIKIFPRPEVPVIGTRADGSRDDGIPDFWKPHYQKLGKDFICVSAQDHYIEVTTTRGATLVLIRFSDALLQLSHIEGYQVHRSHWVSKSAIRGYRVRNGKHCIALARQMEVPASKARIADLKKDAWFAKLVARA